MKFSEIEKFLAIEKERVKKLYTTKKHKPGFKTNEDFVNWYVIKILNQNFKCYYCKTSIFDINKLIDAKKLKTRKTGYGKRGNVLEIDKKINETGYNPDNCVLSCYYCNNDKSYILDSEEYKKHFGKNRKKYFRKLLNSLNNNASVST